MAVHVPPHELRTEIDFTLRKGFVDSCGVIHRHGTMRLATAADEILPQRDPRVQTNPAYLAVIVLSRVLTRLGNLQDIDVKVVEGLFAADFDQLQRLYEEFNAGDDDLPPPAPSAEPFTSNEEERGRGVPVMGEA